MRFLRIVLFLGAILCLLAAALGAVYVFRLPWWMLPTLLAGALGVLLITILCRRFLIRRREQHFVRDVISQDKQRLVGKDDRQQEQLQDLQKKWKNAIDVLRRSHLRKRGNPLYVLPWYMIVGESGSGKTTAINSARLTSPFGEINKVSGISGTKNCDWWFFEQGIFIDTAGRYAIPVDEGRDKEEWHEFLKLLRKFRRKEPLNGLVVTVGAEKLLESTPDRLSADGVNIRKRIDELMRVLGARFPVYILVTKCDLIKGMTQFCDHLDEKRIKQAMGCINQDLRNDAVAFIEDAVRQIGDRLRNHRLLLLHYTGSRRLGFDDTGKMNPELFLFPEEFENLKSGLKTFVAAAFQENPYQETPSLRGIYFSSGRQEGSPYSHFLNALGLIGRKEILPATNKGLFLHDFFSSILPGDRRLFTPTQWQLAWTRSSWKLMVAMWVAIGLALSGMLSYSFVRNLRVIDTVRVASRPPLFQGDPLADVALMENFSGAILTATRENEGWWNPRLGLNKSKDFEVRLKKEYCKIFKTQFLDPSDTVLTRSLVGLTASTPGDIFGRHVAYLVERIGAIRDYLGGGSFEVVQARFALSYMPVELGPNQVFVPEIGKRFGILYLYFLFWRNDLSSLNQEINQLQASLKHLLTQRRTDLNWLADWVSTDPKLSGFGLSQFWGSQESLTAEGEDATYAKVKPAFTLAGRQKIGAFLDKIEYALPDPLVIGSQKTDFERWYRRAYVSAWHQFGEGFSKGQGIASNRDQRLLLAGMMGKNGGPYFSMLKELAEQLSPFEKTEDAPSWVGLVADFEAVKMKAQSLRSVGESKGWRRSPRRPESW